MRALASISGTRVQTDDENLFETIRASIRGFSLFPALDYADHRGAGGNFITGDRWPTVVAS